MNISIEFTPRSCNGNAHLSVLLNGLQQARWHDSCTDPQVINIHSDIDSQSPFELELVMWGKDQMCDTELSKDVIVNDKAIVLDSITIDGVRLYHELYLFPFVCDSGEIVPNTLHWGFNGRYRLRVEPGLLEWQHWCRSQLAQPKSSFQDFLSEIFS